MRTYCVFLHVFAALLLCDYGTFSEPLPTPSEMSSTEITNTSDPYTTAMTGESETITNNSIMSPVNTDDLINSTTDHLNGSGDGQSVETTSADPSVTESSKGPPVINTGVTSSAASPKRDTTQKGPIKEDSGSLTGGIIILILILILIVFLLGILYFLRKKGRSYSFDLTRVEVSANDYVDTPLQGDQQGISYEQTNKDLAVCLDYVQEEKSEEKTNPIANGSAGEKTEQTTTNENDEQNVPEENSFSSDSSLTTPGYIKRVEFDLDLDLLGGGSDLNDSSEAEATDTPQNENNNNVSNAGRGTEEEIFTEISLDEPK